MIVRFLFFFILLFSCQLVISQPGFVRVKDNKFTINNQPYYYIGTNYWYGGLLALQKDKTRGIERLRKELDFLKQKGVINLRVLAGAEGTGMVNGVQRVNPALQPTKGEFNEEVITGLDILLDELYKRDMKAVIFFSNNWEWSGGFLQYLKWNNLIEDSLFKQKMHWDTLRDYTSKFYTCDPCKEDYKKQVTYLLNRTNKINNRKYINDPAIMAWELANEPRPMRPAANEAYTTWINDIATFIKSKDKNHLVTLGHEGSMATDGDMKLYEQVHAFPNVDYLTIHIWPKNWSWFKGDDIVNGLSDIINNTISYIDKHVEVAEKLNKPLVIEEFGLPRDNHSFDIKSSTGFRDVFYNAIFAKWHLQKGKGVIGGVNFWAFGGTARPIQNQIFWKEGDDLMGDPPMEEQGLNSVFTTDTSTWNLIENYTKKKKNGK